MVDHVTSAGDGAVSGGTSQIGSDATSAGGFCRSDDDTARHAAGMPDDNATDGPTTEELETLWRQFEESEPVLTIEQVELVDKNMSDLGSRRTRRGGLAILTKSGAELLQMVHDGDESTIDAFRELRECLHDHVENVRAIAEALHTAATRLGMALCDAGAPTHPARGDDAEVNHA